MSVIHEISLNGTFDEEFCFNLSPIVILNDFDNYLNIENSCFKTIDKNILNNIKNKKLTLIIKLTNEGDIDEMALQIFQKLLNHYGIPNDECILIHDSYRLPHTSIKNYQTHTHLYSKSREANELDSKNKLNKSIIKNKQYRFHLPIRRFRYHRLLLLDKLYSNYPDFIDSNLVSYDINAQLNIKSLNSFNGTEIFKKYLTSTIAKFIDTDNIENVDGYGYENKDTYFNSYFTIVTETYFFEPYYYISEKTFKPIAHMHPFIILGRPGMIEYLKKFGFKTFHPFIDESYDLEENDDKRFEMVYSEIVKLNELSDEELDNFMDKIKDILHYNQQKLLQIGGHTKMISELNRYIIKNLNNKNLI
jgi:hypothetical protein